MANKIVNAVKKIKLGDSNAKSILRELADCANADGFCFPSYATIAEVLEVSPKSIQRGMNFLISNGWVIREEKPKINGKFVGFTFQINLIFLGLSEVDFTDENPVDNLTNGQSDQWTICPLETNLPVDNLSEKTAKPVDNLTNGQIVHQNPNKKDLFLNPQSKEYNQKREREREAPTPTSGSTNFQSSIRNIGIHESTQNFIPRTDALANSPPVKLFEEKFKITVGNAFAEELDKTVTDFDIWKNLLKEKIAFADEPIQSRKAMQKWILTAYAERLEKKQNANGAKNRNGNRQLDTQKRLDGIIRDAERFESPKLD